MIYPGGSAGTDVSVFKVAESTVTPGNYMLVEAPGFENYRTEYMVGDSFNMEDGRVAVLAFNPSNPYIVQANPIQKMTAGTNITISSDGTISASGGTGSFSPADQLQYNLTGFTPTNSTGNTYWDADAGTLATVLDSTAGVVLQHGQELLLACTNKTAASIPDGTVVYIDGAQGNHPTCAPAKADAIGTCQIIGMTTQAIAVNATGFVTLAGHVHGFDTSIFASTGMTLYLSASTAGGVTTTAPSSPNFVVIVGRNLNTTNNGIVMITASRPLAADTLLSANTNMVAPSQAAVKSYADTKQAALGYTPVNKAGDTGVGDISMGELTATGATIAGAVDKSISVQSEFNKAFFGSYQNYAYINVNRDTTSGAWNDTGKATVGVYLYANANDSRFIVGTSPTNNVPDTIRLIIDKDGKADFQGNAVFMGALTASAGQTLTGELKVTKDTSSFLTLGRYSSAYGSALFQFDAPQMIFRDTTGTNALVLYPGSGGTSTFSGSVSMGALTATGATITASSSVAEVRIARTGTYPGDYKIGAGGDSTPRLYFYNNTSDINELILNNGAATFAGAVSMGALTASSGSFSGTFSVNNGGGTNYAVIASSSMGLTVPLNGTSFSFSGAGTASSITGQYTGAGYGSLGAGKFLIQNEDGTNTRMYACGSDASTFGVFTLYSCTSATTGGYTFSVGPTGAGFSGSVSMGALTASAESTISGGTAMTGGWNRNLVLASNYPGIVFNSCNAGWASINYDYSSDLIIRVGATTSDTTASGVTALRLNASSGAATFAGDVTSNNVFIKGGGVLDINPGTTGNATISLGTVGSTSSYIQTSAFGVGYGMPLSINALGGNVGIGTTAPNYSLEVVKAGDVAIGITATSAGSTNLNLYPTGGGLGQINVVGANHFTVRTNNVERMRIDSSGNVGIGTTDTSSFGRLAVVGSAVGADILCINTDATRVDIQSYNKPLAINRQGNNTLLNEGGGNVGIGTTSPATQLHVSEAAGGTAAINNITWGNGNGGGQLGTTAAGMPYLAGYVANSNIQLGYQTSTNTPSTFTPAMTIAGATGNVGIGTTAPYSHLSIKGSEANSTVGAGTAAVLSITNSSTASYGNLAELIFAADNDTANFRTAAISSAYTNWTASGLVGDLRFSTRNNAGAMAERMRISADGDVGIGRASAGSIRTIIQGEGTTSSSYALVTTDSAGSNSLQVRNDGYVLIPNGNVGIGTTSPSARLHVVNNANGFHETISITGTGDSGAVLGILGNGATTPNKYLRAYSGNLQILNSAINASIFELTDDGKLGLGNSSPGYKLDVTGTGRFTSTLYANGSITTTSISASGAISSSDSIYSSGNVTAYSDRKLKTNIRPLESALDKALSLVPVRYNWIDTTRPSNQIGLIAQEVQAIVPEVVTEHEGTLGIDYGKLVAVLIGAIQEQQEQINDLKRGLA